MPSETRSPRTPCSTSMLMYWLWASLVSRTVSESDGSSPNG